MVVGQGLLEIAHKEVKYAQSEMEENQQSFKALNCPSVNNLAECDAQMILLVFSDLTVFDHSFSGWSESL